MYIADPEIAKGLYPYLSSLVPDPHPVIMEMEAYARERGFPMIGRLVGRFVYQQAMSIGAKKILEMGSGFGYSAAWFTQVPDARVICTDGSEDNVKRGREYLDRLGVGDRVDYYCGFAQEIVQREDVDQGPFDIVFCDIDKQDYPEALELAIPRLRVGGLIIFDNVIWSGYAWAKVPDDAPEYRQRMTPGVRKVNEMFFERDDLFTCILPIRDGVAVATKLK